MSQKSTGRKTEFRLTVLVLMIFCWFFYFSISSRMESSEFQWSLWIVPVIFIACSLASHVALLLSKSVADQVVLPLTVLLAGIGLSYQLRFPATPGASGFSLAVFIQVCIPVVLTIVNLVLRGERYKFLSGFNLFWIVPCFVFPLLPVVAGSEFRGGRYGPGLTTPGEFYKLFFILWISGFLSRQPNPISHSKPFFSSRSLKAHLHLIIVWGIPQIFFLMQKDLGMIAINFTILILYLWAVTGRWRYWVIGLFAMLTSGWVIKTVLAKGIARFQAWNAPFDHPDGAGYQIIQALFALFSGEFLGKGIGAGAPSKIPLVNTDFVYAIIAEELGFVGSICILWIYLVLARRCYFWAEAFKSRFEAFIAVGTGSLLLVQTVFNIGGVVKLMPMTGVPLPFISHGGSAALTFALLLGILSSSTENLRVSHRCIKPSGYGKKKKSDEKEKGVRYAEPNPRRSIEKNCS